MDDGHPTETHCPASTRPCIVIWYVGAHRSLSCYNYSSPGHFDMSIIPTSTTSALSSSTMTVATVAATQPAKLRIAVFGVGRMGLRHARNVSLVTPLQSYS